MSPHLAGAIIKIMRERSSPFPRTDDYRKRDVAQLYRYLMRVRLLAQFVCVFVLLRYRI